MFRKAFSFSGLLLLAGAAVLVTPGSGQAQHRGGGGHGGGFHSSGFSHGSFNRGGFSHGSFNHGSFNHGSFNHGNFNHGNFNHRGFNHGNFNHRGFNHGRRWWYPGYYGNYGAWPYYGSYSYPYSGYSDYYPYGSYWLSPSYDLGSYGSDGGGTSYSPQSYPTATAQPDARAQLTVSVPADAEIWLNGMKMTSTGSVREYQSPPLTRGSRYTYEVRARWSENGHDVTQSQQVEISAGSHVNVQFPVHPTSAPTPPSR